MLSLTRKYAFSASHRLHSRELSDSENARLYGKCNHPFGHGHDYVLSVTVTGEPGPRTGLLLRRAELDGLVSSEVLRPLSHKNLNSDVPQFAALVPTTENLAAVVTDLLERHWNEYIRTGEPRLMRVHIQETDRNGFEIIVPDRSRKLNQKEAVESEIVHA